jgi:hypothetical protein
MPFTIYQWQSRIRDAGVYGSPLWLANLVAKRYVFRSLDLSQPVDLRTFPIERLERNGVGAWEWLRDAGYFTGTMDRAIFSLPASDQQHPREQCEKADTAVS